jgi:hypothetical protein
LIGMIVTLVGIGFISVLAATVASHSSEPTPQARGGRDTASDRS